MNIMDSGILPMKMQTMNLMILQYNSYFIIFIILAIIGSRYGNNP